MNHVALKKVINLKEIIMKEVILTMLLTTGMTFIAGSGFGQMMGNTKGSPTMMEGYEKQQPAQTAQNNPYQMYPGVMMGGNYGYGMGSGMMGGNYGYGMGSGMMGGYGMMQGYGYPSMMGSCSGNSMYPGMMMGGYSGYGMYPGMMGYYGSQEDIKNYQEKQEKFLQDTKELRKKLYMMKFDYSELARDPKANQDRLQEMGKAMFELIEKIQNKAKE